MKTPKRHYKTPANQLAQDIEPDFFESDYHTQEARWKRKNRAKQLKRSLEKYKYGTHLSGDIGAAYRRLQCMVRPGRHATLAEWAAYLNELRRIQELITCAITNTAIVLAYDVERKVKERKKGAEMKKNPRIIAELAKEFKCKPEEIIGYSPSYEALSRTCGTCRYFRDNLCDIGDGNPLETTADTHSCGWFLRKEYQ